MSFPLMIVMDVLVRRKLLVAKGIATNGEQGRYERSILTTVVRKLPSWSFGTSRFANLSHHVLLRRPPVPHRCGADEPSPPAEELMSLGGEAFGAWQSQIRDLLEKEPTESRPAASLPGGCQHQVTSQTGAMRCMDVHLI